MAKLGYIQVTRRCNQRCRFCSNPESGYRLTLAGAEKLVDDLVRRGQDGVIFTGGEPTLVGWLPKIIEYAARAGIAPRLITNGQNTADAGYVRMLKEAGLRHVHVSIHSTRPRVQAFLSSNPGSLKNILRSLGNLGRAGMASDVNVVINKYNCDHLHEIVRKVSERFPHVRHFVLNGLDPTSERARRNTDTICRPHEYELSLAKACAFMAGSGLTFRVERVPLCYMAEFAHFSTETRKIVLGEERVIHFLDGRGAYEEKSWRHGKADACKACLLDSVCAGVFEADLTGAAADLYPVFVPADEVRKAVAESV